jgi:hypothetical protein
MKKIIRLTESDLKKIIKSVINEIGDYDMDLISQYRGKVIEQVNIKGYELSLIDFPMGKTVSLTYNDKGYSKPGEQNKQPMEYKGGDTVNIFKTLKPYIIDWVKKYGIIFIGTTNKRRINYYHKWICDDMECGQVIVLPEFNPNEPQYSFWVK